MVKTNEVIPYTHQGLATLAIRVVVNGVVQEGTMGAGYETEAEANYWAKQLASDDKGRG